jgi:hypothetical protein
MRFPPTLCAALLALPLLAACDDDGGGPDRLDPSAVAGVYNLCELRFTPSNTLLRQADLMATVVDTTPPAGRPEATASLTPSGIYDLVYTRQGDAFLRQLQGSVDYGATTVTLNTPSESPIAEELLLPRPLTLTFTETNGRALAAQSQFAYSVDRADYARAANASEEGLAATIPGSMSIVLSAAACP